MARMYGGRHWQLIKVSGPQVISNLFFFACHIFVFPSQENHCGYAKHRCVQICVGVTSTAGTFHFYHKSATKRGNYRKAIFPRAGHRKTHASIVHEHLSGTDIRPRAVGAARRTLDSANPIEIELNRRLCPLQRRRERAQRA